jgi:putative heme-binding domain-containing protein
MFRLVPIALILLASIVYADPPLKVPSGFTIEKVAGSPLVKFPVLGDFDDRGRLYVIDMAGPISHADVASKKAVHKIVRLESTKGDGTFDKATSFADNLPFPEGVLHYRGSIYTACPPQILKLTDTDGDGKADQREVWFDGKTLTGCANDMHGPYLGPDGYFYWTKGAFAKQELTLGTGTKFTTRASHVFRAKPDGSGLEVMMTGGMDNPIGIAFAASGDVIVSNTFLQHPADGKRDGLIHAVPGGVWGKDHDPIYEHPWTSPRTMPIMTHMGPAAQFNLRKISRHIMVPKGSTYETKDSDFVTSDDPDFHPTDVIEDKDGSMLVIDTGGWYKLCCPSSQLVKADVWGGIYRVKKVGSHSAKSEARNQPVVIPELHQQRRWAESATIADLPKLRELLAKATDQHLEHAATYAIIRTADFNETAKGLKETHPRILRGTITALEAIDAKKLKSSDVLYHLASRDPALRETAWWIAGKHPEWGGELVGYFRKQLDAKLSDAEREELTTQLAKFAKNEAVQKLLAETATNSISLKAMARAGLKVTPESWQMALATAAKTNPMEAIATVRTLPMKTTPGELTAVLRDLSNDAKSPASQRLAAFGAISNNMLTDDSFNFVLAQLTAESGPIRAAASDVFARSLTNDDQLAKLAAVLKNVSPVELGKLLPVFAKSTSESVGLAILTSLNEPKIRASIRSEQLKPLFEKYPSKVKAEAAKLYAILDVEISQQREKLDTLIKELPTGDIQRGHKVFNSQKAACATCHNIGYVGGKTGPDLTRIGSIRTERDLLEAIVYPSLSFVRSYEPMKVETLDGRQFNGILKKDAPDEIILVVAADKEERISRENIESIKPSSVSVMPAGLDQQLSKQDLADLVAFLKASR